MWDRSLEREEKLGLFCTHEIPNPRAEHGSPLRGEFRLSEYHAPTRPSARFVLEAHGWGHQPLPSPAMLFPSAVHLFHTSLRTSRHCLHFTDGEMEAPKGCVTCPRSHRLNPARWDSRHRSSCLNSRPPNKCLRNKSSESLCREHCGSCPTGPLSPPKIAAQPERGS